MGESVLVQAFTTSNGCESCERLDDNMNLLKRFQDMIDNMPMMCNIFDADFQIVDCNQKTCEIFGMEKEEFIGKFHETLPEFQPDGKPSMEKALEKIKQAFEQGTCSFEWVDRKLDGELIPSHVSLVRFEWKQELYVVAFVHDRREYHKLQAIERATKERMKNMLDSSPSACLIINDEFKLTEMNSVFKSLFGLKSDLITFEDFVELAPTYQPDGRLSAEKLSEMIHKTLEVGRNSFEWLHQTTLMEAVPCEVTLVRAEQENKAFVMAYISDLRKLREASELSSKLKQMEDLAYTDPLTGAYNRRYFMERSREEIMKLDKIKPFAIIMMDIDFFKRINDTYGHPVGDEVLKILVQRLRNVLKSGTVFARFGGEEFIVVLPGVGSNTASEVAWRINKVVEGQQFQMGEIGISVTVSLGVSAGTRADSNLDETISNADKALYEAKLSGRNTVVVG